MNFFNLQQFDFMLFGFLNLGYFPTLPRSMHVHHTGLISKKKEKLEAAKMMAKVYFPNVVKFKTFH